MTFCDCRRVRLFCLKPRCTTGISFGAFLLNFSDGGPRQGAKVGVIACQVGINRQTVRKYISRGLDMTT